MKRLNPRLVRTIVFSLLLVAASTSAAAVEFPQYTGYVNDYVGLLSQADKAKLTALLTELDKKTTAQVAVVIVGSTEPLDLESYSVGLAQEWGIGRKGKDNGVLILIAKDDRKMRIEVGYGLEPNFTDGMTGRIIREYFTPNFKAGRLDYGTVVGTTAVANHVASIYGVKLEGAGSPPNAGAPGPGQPGLGWGSLGILPLFILLLLFRGFWRFFLFGSLLGVGRRGGFWGGGGGFGGSSGGFGGFGGGSFGGGGASGSW